MILFILRWLKPIFLKYSPSIKLDGFVGSDNHSNRKMQQINEFRTCRKHCLCCSIAALCFDWSTFEVKSSSKSVKTSELAPKLLPDRYSTLVEESLWGFPAWITRLAMSPALLCKLISISQPLSLSNQSRIFRDPLVHDVVRFIHFLTILVSI